MSINRDLTYAVVGASHDKNKYGYKVFQDLLRANLEVVPINPKGGQLIGRKVYPSVNEYPGKIEVVVLVVPPQVSEKILQQIPKSVKKVWFQPGSESDQAIEICLAKNIKVVSHTCIMQQRLT